MCVNGTQRQIKSSLVAILAHCWSGSPCTVAPGDAGKLVMQQSGDVWMATETRGSGDALQRKLLPKVDIISKS